MMSKELIIIGKMLYGIPFLKNELIQSKLTLGSSIENYNKANLNSFDTDYFSQIALNNFKRRNILINRAIKIIQSN